MLLPRKETQSQLYYVHPLSIQLVCATFKSAWRPSLQDPFFTHQKADTCSSCDAIGSHGRDKLSSFAFNAIQCRHSCRHSQTHNTCLVAFRGVPIR